MFTKKIEKKAPTPLLKWKARLILSLCRGRLIVSASASGTQSSPEKLWETAPQWGIRKKM